MSDLLQSENIALTALRTADSPTLFRWINEREERLLSSTYRPVDEPSHEKWLASVTGREDLVIFAIRRRSDDRLIGTCQLHSIDLLARSAELQIRIGEPDARDKGYGTEAVRLLLSFGFRDLDLLRIHLHVLATNERAIRTYEKVGFVREGVMRRAAFIDGERRDLVLMAILREEFRDV